MLLKGRVFVQMALDVLVQVAFLGKGQRAAHYFSKGALKWFLVCVGPDVIVEIVPLPERHRAALVVTFHDLEIAIGIRIDELVNFEAVLRGDTSHRVPFGVRCLPL